MLGGRDCVRVAVIPHVDLFVVPRPCGDVSLVEIGKREPRRENAADLLRERSSHLQDFFRSIEEELITSYRFSVRYLDIEVQR